MRLEYSQQLSLAFDDGSPLTMLRKNSVALWINLAEQLKYQDLTVVQPV